MESAVLNLQSRGNNSVHYQLSYGIQPLHLQYVPALQYVFFSYQYINRYLILGGWWE